MLPPYYIGNDMGNDCFSLIRCFLFQSFCGCKGTDFYLNLQYLKMIILAEIWFCYHLISLLTCSSRSILHHALRFP